jgi:glycosyltransferase involved in cell wall biosynthesis
MKVAIVHEWLDSFAGSERVVEQLLAEWPQADLHVLVDVMPEAERGWLGGRAVRTSFLQRMPFARRHFRKYLGLMPLAIEQFDMTGYDLVLSSSHAVAKGVITGPGQLHVSYVHSPMRYAWDLQHQYLRESGMERGLKGIYARRLLHRLRQWDRSTASSPDVVVANSTYIAERIAKAWRRESIVVHPPVDVDRFAMRAEKSDFYLTASRMVPYKRIEVIAAAFARMPGRRLVIVGDGASEPRVREAAAGAPNIDFRGRIATEELVLLTQSARACVFAAEEDFGIATVEALACGTPVIAYGRGGARDIVTPPDTGLFFDAQTPEAIIAAVERFEALAIDPATCRAQAERFSRTAFRAAMRRVVEEARR